MSCITRLIISIVYSRTSIGVNRLEAMSQAAISIAIFFATSHFGTSIFGIYNLWNYSFLKTLNIIYELSSQKNRKDSTTKKIEDKVAHSSSLTSTFILKTLHHACTCMLKADEKEKKKILYIKKRKIKKNWSQIFFSSITNLEKKLNFFDKLFVVHAHAQELYRLMKKKKKRSFYKLKEKKTKKKQVQEQKKFSKSIRCSRD